MMALGFVLYDEGATSESQQMFRKAYHRSRRLANLSLALSAAHNLAFILIEQGQRGDAESLCLHEMELLEATFGSEPPIAGCINSHGVGLLFGRRDRESQTVRMQGDGVHRPLRSKLPSV